MESKFKEVPGRQEGQVKVLVRESVLKRWGEPTVNFEGLTGMVEEAGLPPEDLKIKLYSGRFVGGEGHLKKIARGGRVPLTKTVYSGVGLNGTLGLPHPYGLPEEKRSELDEGARTAVMSKLVRNVLKAAGVKKDIYEKERDLYEEHASDILFKNPSPGAW